MRCALGVSNMRIERVSTNRELVVAFGTSEAIKDGNSQLRT